MIQRSRVRNLVGYAILFCFTFLMLETVLYLMFHLIEKKHPHFFYHRKTSIDEIQLENILAKRDSQLGWVSSFRKDASGARFSPGFHNPGKACISLYGDSFTESAEASSDETAWGNVLSKLEGCRVANYGAGGYGTDQAVLRFELNGKDEANVVVLGIVAHDLLRNLTGNFGFISFPRDISASKPRFTISESGELSLIPLKELSSKEQLREHLMNPDRNSQGDYFVWDGPEGAVELKFPYGYTLYKLLKSGLFSRSIKRFISGKPSWSEFLEPEHPSQALRLEVQIVRRFVSIAEKRGKRPLVIIMPDIATMSYFRKSGTWAYENLLKALEREGIAPVNTGVEFLKILGNKDHSVIFNRPGYPDSHYSDEGYRLLATIVSNSLKQMKP